ncbi:MAG: glycosyltransferase family 4 protein [Bacteroidales bacterium]|nr:glycosyltransferase family 4 protein [Bacteroidales bacterium]
MNILQIANKATTPPDGGVLAILSLLKGYVANKYNVHLLNMLTYKHNKNISIDNAKIAGVSINTKISIPKLIFNFLFSSKPYIACRFVSSEYKQKLIEELNTTDYQIIQFEGLYSLQYVNIARKYSRAKLVYRPHNIEYLIWQRNVCETKSILKKIYFKSLANRLRKLENKLLNKYDYIIPISDQDKQTFVELGNNKPIKTIPFGLDVDLFANYKQLPNDNASLVYIGALDWIPNQQGLIWFINEVLPLIKKEIPNIQLNVGGRNAPEWFKTKLTETQNVNFCGELEDAYRFMQSSNLMVVPLFSGSGMRVKIIEGMALRKTIVATDIAAEGIDCQNKENIFITNQSKSFAKYIVDLINNPQLCRQVGDNAFSFVNQKFDNKKITQELINFIKKD